MPACDSEGKFVDELMVSPRPMSFPGGGKQMARHERATLGTMDQASE